MSHDECAVDSNDPSLEYGTYIILLTNIFDFEGSINIDNGCSVTTIRDNGNVKWVFGWGYTEGYGCSFLRGSWSTIRYDTVD